MVKLIFVGIQGSGKGTQAQIISKKMGICPISSGDLLRGSEGELKKEVDSYINNGNLVPDELILRILKQRIDKPDCKKGFILDGYPRNSSQIKDLKKITSIDKAVYIKISDKEAIKRMKGRWNCKKCSIAYNYATEPKPKVLGICDKCHGKLEQRKDDVSDEAIQKRLETFHSEISAILKGYPIIDINGEQTIEQVTNEIMQKLETSK